MNRPTGCVAAIDISAAQGVVNWQEVAASGVQACFVECFVGNDGPNVDRAAQVSGALKAGLRVIPYFFAFPLPSSPEHTGRDPVGQVALWIQSMKGLGLDPGQPCVLDLEWPAPEDFGRWEINDAFVRGWVLAACAELAVKTSIIPWIYTTPSFAEAIDTSSEPEFAKYPLWIANWETTKPIIPEPWGSWAAWQYDDKGSVPGVSGPVDLSWLIDTRNAPTDPDMKGNFVDDDDEVTIPGMSMAGIPAALGWP